jgi:adenylate kinase family enzyme
MHLERNQGAMASSGPNETARAELKFERMKRVAIFGNAGGGKSTLARELAAVTGLPLYVIDKIKFLPGGAEVPHEEYLRLHNAIVEREEWIIDGFESVKLAWQRFEAADTLIHVDLPLAVHALWVTKRLVQGLFVDPPGWPEGSPVISSSIQSYRVLWPCHTRLTPKYRSYLLEVAQRKRVFHLRSRRELGKFLEIIRNQVGAAPRRAAQPVVQPESQASDGTANGR